MEFKGDSIIIIRSNLHYNLEIIIIENSFSLE
jgi:hypothetical protein